MNVIMKNFVISMVTVVLAGLALWSSDADGGGVNIPWYLLVGALAIGIVSALMLRFRRGGTPEEPQQAAPAAKKKGRGK